jgi:hypothetical protein
VPLLLSAGATWTLGAAHAQRAGAALPAAGPGEEKAGGLPRPAEGPDATCYLLDADAIAREALGRETTSTVMAGALLKLLPMLTFADLEQAIREMFGVRAAGPNLEAARAGFERCRLSDAVAEAARRAFGTSAGDVDVEKACPGEAGEAATRFARCPAAGKARPEAGEAVQG